MKKLICILLSLMLMFTAVTAMATVPNYCQMHDVYTTWSVREVYAGDEVTLTVHASGCGNDYTFGYQLNYIGDIVSTDGGLWSADAPIVEGSAWADTSYGYMQYYQMFMDTKDPTLTFIPYYPGFYEVYTTLTDVNGHTASIGSMTLCVMTPGVETASSMLWTNAKAAVDEVVTPGMTDRQKAEALHDWVTTHLRYGYPDMTASLFADFGAWTIHYLNLTALLSKEGICLEYAGIYQLLCFIADIPCIVVSSNSMNHAWNAVRIDGEWLQVDCTWDDPIVNYIGMDEPLSGAETHAYLFMNEEQIAARNWDYDEARLILGISK